MNFLITGASSGIGEALAIECAKREHNVAIVARRTDRLELIAKRIRDSGGTVHIIPGNVADEASCKSIALKATRLMGSVDVLVNNAGQGNMGSVEDTTTEVFHNMMLVNLYSTFWLTREVLPQMRARDSGHIIAISSVAGKIGYPYNAAYVAAKHAVIGFMASLRAELTDTNVQATVVCPAGVTTEWSSASQGGVIGDVFAKGIKFSRSIAAETGRALSPLSKMMSPEQAAQTIYNTAVGDRSNDVFTHPETMRLADLASTQRMQLEDEHYTLFKGMQKAYAEGAGK